MRPPLAVGTTAAGTGLGLPAALLLLLGCEAGLPIPLPADVLMIAVGTAVSTGHLRLWEAVLGLELIAVVGTTALLLGARGPAAVLISRLGPRVGLTAERLASATRLLERRGRPALAIGRATPGLRTVTVVAAAASASRPRQLIPILVLGSTVFLQAHLFLGVAIGPVVRSLLHQSGGLLALAGLVLALVGAAILLGRRRRATSRLGWVEGSCPACLALSRVAGPELNAEVPLPQALGRPRDRR